MSAAVAGSSADGRPRPDGDVRNSSGKHQENDIKDYAETTMNELLGWYGYDKLDTRGINLKTLNHQYPATSSSSSSPTRIDDDASEEDTGRSLSPINEKEMMVATSGGGSTIVCAWCMKMGLKLFTLKTSSGETKEFCSEPCFNQCRRAAFKKNRVCNWCRHVRHTVNYVDFQDGDDQLQFCSDKCLNQYKMQIFCRETQAYLQMNPHLQEEASKNAASSKLITPDLWLRDCHETSNGEVKPGDNEAPTKNKNELEDLSMAAKSERNNTYNATPERDKNHSPVAKDNVVERCNTLASYLTDDKDKVDRKKRLDLSRENFRKRPRTSSFKKNVLTGAPPAHLSSAHSSIPFQTQGPIFPSSNFPVPLQTKSPVHISPPAAHSKPYNPGIPALHPGLPPPPPLLNNEFYHPAFNLPGLTPQQQQIDAFIRMQAGLGPAAPFAPNMIPESLLPLLRNSSESSHSSILSPNTVMLPYPIFVPLPVPIPVPIPLAKFLPKNFSVNKESDKQSDVKELSQDVKSALNESMKSSSSVTGDNPNELSNHNKTPSTENDIHKYTRKLKRR